MKTNPLYIFDLDGTLAFCQHRLPLISNGEKRWREFYEACDRDTPNRPVIQLLNSLRALCADVWIFTGRSDIVRAKTEHWLFAHTSLSQGELDVGLFMRQEGIYLHDDQLKEQWLQALAVKDRERLVAVFEDRTRVVEMWRRNGITCLQVASGDF